MAAANTAATLDALFKEIYADKVENLIPESAQLTKDVPFREAESVGRYFHQPVSLTDENGVTYAASGDGAFTLNSSVAMTVGDAQVNGSMIIVRSQFDYESMAKSTTSKKAFIQATELGVMRMMGSHTKRLEIDCVYGGVLGTTSSSANASATSTVLTLTSASYAAGIWGGLEGAVINFYTTVPAIVGSPGTYTITAVNVTNRTVTVSGTSGDITSLDTAAAAGALTIYFNGANGKVMSGLYQIMTNTGSLFNISASTYNLWAGNTYDVVSGSLSLTKIQAGLATAVNRGLNEPVNLYVNPTTFGNMVSNESALRRYNDDSGSAKNGFEDIEFYGPNGVITVIPHLFVKNGDAFALPLTRTRRLGAADITFKTPWQGEQIFIHLQTQAGIELRTFSHQAIFIEAPARTVYFKNIS